MNRQLSGVLGLAGLVGLACEDQSPSTPLAGRVDAVVASQPKKVTMAELCDVSASGSTAMRFELPALDQPAPPKRPGAWRWINVWATWCKPCVEEVPMIRRWANALRERGQSIDLLFLSVDGDAETVAKFRRQHPGIPDGPRIEPSDDKVLGAWLTSLGLDASAGIPIHIFVSPDERVRCVRAGKLAFYHDKAIGTLLDQAR